MPDKTPAPSAAARPYIGGQAVLEGVMMRAPQSFAIVVRRRDGSLYVRERGVTDTRSGPAKWPLVRGITSLVESLKLGSEALRFSVEQMEKDFEIEEARERARGASTIGNVLQMGTRVVSALGMTLFTLATLEPQAPETSPGPNAKAVGRPKTVHDREDVKKEDEKKSKGPMGFMLAISIIFLIALPQAAAAGVNRLFGLHLALQSAPFQVLTGAMKLSVVIGYLLVIRRVADIRRVFQYHGAEHKTITTYEAQEELVVANARTKTTLHPRCGTTFLVMVALMSILVFTAVGGLLPQIKTGNAILDNVVFFLEKLPFLPLIAAFTFELQRVFARYCTTGPLRALLWPGFLVQKITTIEPDDDQLEVALASLRATLFREGGEKAEVNDDVAFESYDAIANAERLRAA
jgi:uncharacterized protein YqhQ